MAKSFSQRSLARNKKTSPPVRQYVPPGTPGTVQKGGLGQTVPLSKRENVQAFNLTIPHKYEAREYQKEFWHAMKSGKKRAVLVWHRRAGKDKSAWNYMISRAASQKGIYYYFFPHYGQGRKILWDGIDKDGLRMLDHLPKELVLGQPNSTEMKIRLHNGSIIQVIGSDNIDTIVGTNPIGCVFSEYSIQDPKAWEFIRPILAENDGWAVFVFTPRGENHAKTLYDMAKNNPEWFSQLLTVDDTKAITTKQIEKERSSGMSEDFVQQEFYCSFTLGIQGSYYSQYVEDAKNEKRVTNVPVDTQLPVYTAWDIGYGDACSICFFQICGREVHIVDHYENEGEGLAHYARILQSKPYIYADHYAPHDIESHAFSSGLSAREVGRSLGIRFITLPTLKLSLEDGIEAVRGIFPRFWIDHTRCKHLIKAIYNYRKEYNETRSVYKDKPVHDQWSHAADSLRYLAIAVRLYVDAGKNKIGDREAEDMFKKANPLFS